MKNSNDQKLPKYLRDAGIVKITDSAVEVVDGGFPNIAQRMLLRIFLEKEQRLKIESSTFPTQSRESSESQKIPHPKS
jgi:hypothetical protein